MQSLLNIKIVDNGKVYKIPPWLRFYFELSSFISKNLSPDYILTAAVSIPTRSYASLSIASAAVLSRMSQPPLYNDEDELGLFRQLPINTSILYRKDGVVKRCLFQGIESISGEELIVLKTAKSTIYYVNSSNYRSLCIVPDKSFHLPNFQSGSKVPSVSPLLKSLLSDKDVNNLTDNSRCTVSIVGVYSVLKEEAGRKCLSTDGILAGSFEDLLLLKNHNNPRSAFRTVIIPYSTQRPKIVGDQRPELFIFDSVVGFVHYRRITNEFSKIILLDRTGRNYDEGISEVNHYCATNKVKYFNKVDFSVPSGIELMIYSEAKK